MAVVTVFAISTGKYLDYFARLLPELEQHLVPGNKVQLILATDREPGVIVPKSDRFTVQTVPMEPLTWPDITLLRYHELLKNKDLINGEITIWLDSDMQLKRDVPIELFNNPFVNVALHPCYMKPGADLFGLPLNSLLKGLKTWVQNIQKGTSNGTWDSNESSTAFIPRGHRKKYVHGAVWGGKTSEVIAMCEVLVSRINEDKANGLDALWLDESHLNWYANAPTNEVSVLPKYFSSWEHAWQYKSQKAFFLSLDKVQLDSHVSGNTNIE